MEFKQALSVQLKFLHLHDKVLTAAFTQKKETDRGLTPARTTLAVTASTKRWSEKHLSLQCNVLLETPGPFCRPSTRQSPPPQQDNTPGHTTKTAQECVRNMTKTSRHWTRPRIPQTPIWWRMCAGTSSIHGGPHLAAHRTPSRCPGSTCRRTSQEVLCLCLERLEPVWSHNTSHVVLPSCTAVMDFTKPDNSDCHDVPDTSRELSRAIWLSTSNKLLARPPRSTALTCCLLWLKCHYGVLITSPLRWLVTGLLPCTTKARINKLAMCCWWANPFTSGRSCPWRSL